MNAEKDENCRIAAARRRGKDNFLVNVSFRLSKSITVTSTGNQIQEALK
jgi:hypothetical protein